MGMIESASNNSLWRGVDYFEQKKVVTFKQIGEFEYAGKVKGSFNNVYDVSINTKKPRSSSCNCPFAEGRSVVCKHMIALYFTAVPHAKKEFDKQVRQWELEDEQEQQARIEEIRRYAQSLTKEELVEKYVDLVLMEDEDEQDRWYY